jgi:cell division protein FtsB
MGFATAFYDDDSGLRTWWALRADLRDAERRIESLRSDVAALERDSGGLEADPFALERAIRERLELARPGETLVRLAPRETANTRIP